MDCDDVSVAYDCIKQLEHGPMPNTMAAQVALPVKVP